MILEAIKSLTRMVGRDGWQRLYVYRKLSPGELNSRNIITTVFAGILLTFLLAAISFKAMRPADWKKLIEGRDGIQVLNEDALTLTGVMPKSYECATSCDEFGVPGVSGPEIPIKSPSELNDLSISRKILPTNSSSRFWAHLTYSVSTEKIKALAENREGVIISLHRLSYRFAQIKVGGNAWGVLSNSSPIRVTIPASYLKNQRIDIDVTYSVNENGVSYLDRSDLIPPVASAPEEIRRIQQFEQGQRDNGAAVVGMMSRILIGIFALMLFLFMDSAPETLGLALLLGCEALALGLGQGWISTPVNPFIIHFCSQMGDIFRLYFFLQLARIVKPHTARWLIGGILLSIPWGLAKQWETRLGIDGLSIVPRVRDTFAGTVGALACLSTLWSIRGMNLPWRRAALILGALGSFQQVLGPMTHYIPQLNESDAFRGFFVVFEALAVYILALSTFTNISTLENRVKNLSAAKARNDLIEQELELGRAVQRAFLSIPDLPGEFSVNGSHEAAFYVSGDIHFVNWNESERRFVLLLADVTGHGVQAALKATACYMVAKNLWSDANNRVSAGSRVQSSYLPEYHRQSTEMLTLLSEDHEISAFGGIEIFPDENLAFLYRSNFHTPLVISPDGQGGWSLDSVNLKVGDVHRMSIKDGSVIAMFSDGFVDGSRQVSRLSKFIRARLGEFDGTAAMLRLIFLEFNEQNADRPQDDRTLIVVGWRTPENAGMAEIKKIS